MDGGGFPGVGSPAGRRGRSSRRGPCGGPTARGPKSGHGHRRRRDQGHDPESAHRRRRAGDPRVPGARRRTAFGGVAPEASCARPAPRPTPRQPEAPASADPDVPELHGRSGIHRDRDTGPHQAHAGGCQGLSGAEPCAPGGVLRSASEPANLQADLHGRRFRPLLPDRPLFPRRGPESGPAARVHADRCRGLLRGAGRHPALDGGPDVCAGGRGTRCGGRSAFRADDPSRGARTVRYRPSRPSLLPGDPGLDRRAERSGVDHPGGGH